MAAMNAAQLAADAIGLFLEYRDKHGQDEDTARLSAIAEVAEGAAVDVEALRAESAVQPQVAWSAEDGELPL